WHRNDTRRRVADGRAWGRLMKSGTLTQRVIWALTGVVSIFVAVLALLAYLAFDQMEDGLVEQILTSEGNRIIQHLESDTNYAVPQESSELTGSIRAWLQQNDVPQSMPTPLRDLTPGLHELEPDDETWHV